MFLHHSHGQFGLTKRIRIAEKSRHFSDFLTCHMAAPNGFGSKYDRKIDQNLPNFFFRKKEYKTGLETQFHQNRPHRTDFRLKTARHEKITSSENGPNSNTCVTSNNSANKNDII